MRVEKTYTLVLNQEEAEALKVLLGNFSDIEKKELMLSDLQILRMTDLYDLLPYKDEDED